MTTDVINPANGKQREREIESSLMIVRSGVTTLLRTLARSFFFLICKRLHLGSMLI